MRKEQAQQTSLADKPRTNPKQVSCFWPSESEILGACVHVSLQKIPLLGSL